MIRRVATFGMVLMKLDLRQVGNYVDIIAVSLIVTVIVLIRKVLYVC